MSQRYWQKRLDYYIYLPGAKRILVGEGGRGEREGQPGALLRGRRR